MKLRIQIVTPALAGNRVTATRWARILRSLGHHVELVQSLRGSPEILIALHARRSHDSIRRFHDVYPDRPLILALTGTDVYRDIHIDPDAAESLRLADRLVVLQHGALDQLPEDLRSRARVIHQSATSRTRRRKGGRRLRLAVVGHLRDEKDPFRIVEALSLIPDLPIEVVHAGKALERRFATEGRRWMQREPRYRWMGEVSAPRARQLIADSDALVLTSLLEGGANVITEAVASSVPVLASRISCTVALLGRDYEGLFEVGSSEDLASLIQRFAADARLRARLKRDVRRLRRVFTPRAEREAWRELIREVPFSPRSGERVARSAG